MAWRPTTRHRCNRFLSSIRPCLPLISSAREFFLSLEEEEEEEDSRPDRIASTNREEEEEGRGRISESSCVPLRRTTFLVVRQIRSNLIIVSASPSPFSLLHLLLLLPHIFVIIGCLRIQLHVGLAQLATVFHANVSFFR